MVLLKEKNTLRGQWPLGRIIELYPGLDGHVRVIIVKTKGNLLGYFMSASIGVC
ncbi:hypothetical protein HOLleu_13672 [Holothuria leucospilota]|uniref:DUF5641 domain-containing protein n=1 Tax=Holothuria leucospilota TaxID=206669 RepID=A0A9Q1C826_HOLLE|nr:hypothetical protein HOLleu_13672 [Holothuria leucospilota]